MNCMTKCFKSNNKATIDTVDITKLEKLKSNKDLKNNKKYIEYINREHARLEYEKSQKDTTDNFILKQTILEQEQIERMWFNKWSIKKEMKYINFISTRTPHINSNILKIETSNIYMCKKHNIICSHDCTIYYKNGDIKVDHESGQYIADNYFDSLNDFDKRHFYKLLIIN